MNWKNEFNIKSSCFVKENNPKFIYFINLQTHRITRAQTLFLPLSFSLFCAHWSRTKYRKSFHYNSSLFRLLLHPEVIIGARSLNQRSQVDTMRLFNRIRIIELMQTAKKKKRQKAKKVLSPAESIVISLLQYMRWEWTSENAASMKR